MIFFIPDSSAYSNKNGRILKKKYGKGKLPRQKKAPANRGWKVDQA
jgi:hypothetical protein